MNNMSECEARLLKLKRYLPFLHRTKDYLVSSPGESLKITHLIDIISNAGEQLLAETLERCENFCRTLYLKFGKEDEMKIKMENNIADVRSNARDSRYENSQHPFRAGPDYETPRSPSPEETKRFSLNSVPKAIPNQRADSDLRIKSAPIRQEPVIRESFRHSPIAEHSSRPLRTEPIEIPTMPLHSGVGSVESFSNQDQDYRSVYEQPNGRLSYEERHVSYNRGPPDLPPAGTLFPKRESRFDRYGGDRSSISLGAGRSYEEPFHSNNQPMMSHRDIQPGWDRDRSHSGERDRPFQGRGSINSTHAAPPPLRSRWDSPANQSPHFSSSAPKSSHINRPPDSVRDSGHGSSFRNNEASRLDRQSSSRHESNYGKSWSNRDQSPPVHHHNFDRDSKSGRSYRQNEPTSRHGSSSHPASSEYSVPNSSTSAPHPHSSRTHNYPSSSVPPQQHQNSSQALPSSGQARREDPRLANRPKSSGMLSSPPSSASSQSNPTKTSSSLPPNSTASVPSHPNPPVVSQQRFSTSSTSSASLPRNVDSRNSRPPNKTPIQPPKISSNQPSKPNNKEIEARKEPVKPPIAPTTDSTSAGTSSRNQDEFVSPLDSLYSGASKSGQTGRGYGVQSYKIPKKKTPSVDRSKSKRLDEATVISSESSPVNDLTIDVDVANEDNEETIKAAENDSNHSDKKSEESVADGSSIPLEVIEQILKKNLPSDDVDKVLDRLKTKTDSEINEPSKTTASSSTGATSVPPTSALPGVDETVTSSDDVVLLDTSEDEGTAKASSVSKDVTSSGPQDSQEINSPNKKRAKTRLPLEVARLREDLTDFMKGGIELGSRRCRSKSAQPVVPDATSEDDQRTAPVKPGPPAKRGRKRKATAPEVGDTTTFSPVPVSEEGNENLDDTGSTYSSSVEPNSAMESLAEFPSVTRGQTSKRGRKKKGAGRGKKAGPNNSNLDTDGPSGASKTRMRKKPLVPTHLSLRGRRSMYEDTEPNEQLEENEAPASGDQYFQCQKCSYLGQKIIHHYVNEHPGVEIPFVAMPESEWEAISSQGSATVPAHYRVDADLLSDLSWIPARPNYTSPVQCKLCPYTTCKRSELMEHVMVHALPANCKYRCSLCNLTETNFFDMLDHIAGHTGEFRYRCNYCDFRVAHRPGIKHHMSSMHESQDGLFYTTISLADADQLWIYGFVCRTCRYVQMTEERLERHQALHEECDGYRKVNLISLIQDPNATNTEPEGENRNAGNPVEKEKGVFMCPELDKVRRNDDLDESKLTETLKPLSVSFIETLAEKLANPDRVEGRKLPVSKVEDKPVTQLDPPEEETRMDVTIPETEKDDKPEKKDEENAIPMEIANEGQNIVDKQINDPPRPLTEVWKPNALLETTISKLVDKLGPEIDSPNDLFTDTEETEDIEETLEEEEEDDEEDEEEEEEEEEENEDGEIEDEESMDCDDSVNPVSQAETTGENVAEKPEEKIAIVQDSTKEATAELVDDKVEKENIEDLTDSSGFLRIENVVSLIDNDEADSLDPVTSIVLYSSVTVAKNEVTFPYSTAHDRAKFAVRLKDEETYKKMLDHNRVRNLFKCMAVCCIFSCDSSTDFTNHLEWHRKRYFTPNPSQPVREQRLLPENGGRPYNGETLTLPDFYLCSCCPFGANSSVELAEHVELIHGRSFFQCSACFFRAQSSKMVTIHAMISHQGNKSAFTLHCNRVGHNKPKMQPERLSLVQVPRYRCTVDDCRFACIQRSSLIHHLSTVHTGVKQFSCRQCAKTIVCHNSSDYTQFFLHMNVHEMGFFQCAFCLWGSDLPTDALIHLCLHHPSLDGKLFTRSSQTVPSALKTLLKFWKPGLPNAYTQSHRLHLDQRYAELFEKVVIVEEMLSPEEDIVTLPADAVQEKAIEKPMDVESSVVEAMEEDVTVNRKEPEAEFHGFGEEEQAKAKQQTECILIESDAEEENTQNEHLANDPTNEEADQDFEVHQQGLFGRNLYMCGNIGCDETAESAAAFKDHLLVCDLARDSRLLTCRHCGKNMKLVSNLIEHLRSHGVKRFLCGLCSYRANQAVQVRKHMKTLHRVGVVDEVSIGPGPGPANAENLLHAFYPREMVARLKLRLRTPNKKGATRTFSCRDAQNIPMKSILPFKVKCAHCGYASNVRTNMIRHLAMHECNETAYGTSSEGEEIIPRVIIPDQDPVNPVPHLETPSKGKMFDKMANLAYSSHVKEKPATKERMSTGSFEDPNGADKFQPIFVPDHQRYVCGFNDCGHLTINESMLKYHLQTLHKNAVFSCPHCENDDDQLTLDAFRSHLKMHGPKLYKCGHCVYYHWQQQDIEYHLTEKHPNRPPWQIIVRDPSDAEVKRMQSTSQNIEKGGPVTPWSCSLCKQVGASAAEMLTHVDISHGIKSQFKCALCPVRCNVRSEFDRHFSSKHPNQDVQVLTMFSKVETSESASESNVTQVVASNFEPLWKKDENRLRHIRGILLEENEMKNSNETGAAVKVQQIDPVYGRYGSPSNGQYCCPICDNYRVSYGRDLKIHLFRELDYKKFLCSICNEGSCSRQQALSHVGKQHPNSGAYIREITSNRALEDWVEKVIKIQTDALKLMRATTPNSNKAKKSASSSPATSVPSSPVKSPVKAKKTSAATSTPAANTSLNSTTISISNSNSATSSVLAAISSVSSPSFVLSTPALTITPVQAGAKPTVITVNLDSFADVVLSPSKKSWNCLSCQFLADSEQLLEEHVITTHASESTKAGKQICLECGFKASPKQSLINHQKKTKHSKTNELPDEGDGESTVMAAETENTPKRARLNKPSHPYRCKHCNFSALTEHGMNLHWQRIHSVCQLPLEFECDLPPEVTAAKPESSKIYYKCQQCPVQPGLYEDMREHCKMLHPNAPIKLFRITSKVRHQPESNADAGGSKDSGPLPKVARDEKSVTVKKEVATASPSGATKPQSPKVTSKTANPAASTSSQTVFVVAPTLTGGPPAYACVWCHSKFQQESQVIRHHATHPPNVPLRYTCLDTPKTISTEPSSSTPPKPELAVMEIRFGCPVCPKYFISLAGAQQHVGEHKQAWKCGHCVMLFGTPTLALQHWKEVHPGLQQGRLESDSPNQIVERLSKGITLIRVQLNMKSLLKDKPPQPAQSQSKEFSEIVKDNKTENSSIETPTPSPIPKSTAVARKSTSTNLFLKESHKQDPSTSFVTQELPPVVSEVTRITQS